MFISRFTQEQRDELVGLRAQVTQLSVQLATATATNDWLMARVNGLEKEREALCERLFKVAYDVPVIERTNERRAGPVDGIHGRPIEDGMAVPEHLKSAMKYPAMADARPRRQRPELSAEDEMASSISAQQVSTAAFDDMGDVEAAEHGIHHTEDGAVVYTR